MIHPLSVLSCLRSDHPCSLLAADEVLIRRGVEESYVPIYLWLSLSVCCFELRT